MRRPSFSWGTRRFEGERFTVVAVKAGVGGRAAQVIQMVVLVGVVSWLAFHPVAAQGELFPRLRELEGMLVRAPDIQILRVELEKLRVEQSWKNRVSVHANYSQHFSSAVPFVPTPELAVSGGTFLGISVSVKLGELLGSRTPGDFDRRLKVLEYQRLFQEKLAALRVLYGEREKLLAQLKSLAAQEQTARLQLQKVEIGLSFMGHGEFRGDDEGDGALENALPVIFDPIDLAQAREKLVGIQANQRQAELDVQSVESQILGLLGKGGF